MHSESRCGCCAPLGRRRLLTLAGGCLALAACGEGATGLGLNLVSQEDLAGLGLQEWQQLGAQTPASRNAAHQEAARRVSARILTAARLNPSQWEVRVFADDQANAFALPGNKIGVYDGLFRYARDDAQLAAVLGHEVGHNLEAHAAERVSTQMVAQQGAGVVGAVLGPQVGVSGDQLAAVLGMGAQYGLILPYSRNQELEADAVGLNLMARAGYDPRAAVTLWQNMRETGGGTPTFLSTHPGTDDRIAHLQALMPQALDLYAANR